MFFMYSDVTLLILDIMYNQITNNDVYDGMIDQLYNIVGSWQTNPPASYFMLAVSHMGYLPHPPG